MSVAAIKRVKRSHQLQLSLLPAFPLLLCLALLPSAACKKQNPPAVVNDQAVGHQTPVLPITNMVPIKAGTFVRMNQKVTLTRDFWIGKYEVTQGQYTAIMNANPSHFKDGGTNSPVEKVSNIDAQAYCAELTRRERAAHRLPPNYEYRLPTEAEWEYACRAGSTNLYSFGNDPSLAADFAWTAENSGDKPHPVGEKKPNPWGLHDMHGNVWEWCLDYFEPYPPGDLIDPVGPGPTKFKIFRGGGWNNDIEMARCSNRFMMAPASGIFFVGFRLVLARTSGN